MHIGQLAQKTGQPRDTLRYYVQLGLLQPEQPQGGNNSYLVFQESDVERVRNIKIGQALGFTLRQIKEYIDLFMCNDLAQSKAIELLEEQLKLIQKRKSALEQSEQYLMLKLDAIRTGGPMPELPNISV
jgi:MerR family transcriptional regulator, copper efflux regulator